MLITVEEAKKFIGIDLSDTDYNVEIEALIPDAEAMLYSILKVDGLEEAIKTEWGYWDDGNKSISVTNFPVKSIEKIGGVDYTGVENTDYIIDGKTIEFINIPSADVVNGKVIIEYTYGYVTPIPDNIKLAVKYLTSGLWNTKKEVGVVSVKIGQESYNFSSISDTQDFKNIISQIKTKAKLYIL